MKIIFSRKGFDSTAGGYPSIIFPDGSLFSIPIPGTNDKYLYKELNRHYEGDSIQTILNDLTKNSIIDKKSKRSCDYLNDEQFCHYDPKRLKGSGYTGMALGQVNRAEGHLRKQEVGKGDIFLFYGWFRKVEKQNGTWRYNKTAPNIQLIWSFMEIGEVIRLDSNEQQTAALEKFPFLEDHPHGSGEKGKMKNSIYLSSKCKCFLYHQKRCLTDIKNNSPRSTWRLPICFNHPKAFTVLKNFEPENNDVVISHRGYGQEFVLNLDKIESAQDKESITSYINEMIG